MSDNLDIEERIDNMILNSDPTASNDIVDLYRDTTYDEELTEEQKIYGTYYICPSDSKTRIGKIGYSSSGNIFYVIRDEYRNKGFGFQALSALFQYLSMNNAKGATIFIAKDNTPSIRLAEKIKEVFPIYKQIDSDNGKYVIYNYNISKELNENHKIK